ncbi:hypothetical protein NC653_016170 [Populus alba x Populus x berolinensis]|uniref:Uncharacterized protein n=1 Tax=Populus alba x Populus x berolinensis TaxID=444605 RepID=A0AAD6QM95_9ROSI|nr:hypothetical protein NC653_016170 [Populus alba x Populus x berolinensis]
MLAIFDGFIYNNFDFLVFEIRWGDRTLFWHDRAPIAKNGPKIQHHERPQCSTSSTKDHCSQLGERAMGQLALYHQNDSI